MAADLVVERQVDAPPAEVYKYFTEASLWTRWQGETASIEPTPGGIFRMQMANGMIARGQFVELEANRRVVFTWGWIDHPGLPPGSTTVVIDLLPIESGTLIRLTHRAVPTPEIQLHKAGWHHYLERLGTAVEGEDPGPDHGPPR